MYGLHHLLWDLRKDPKLAARYRRDPAPVIAGYPMDHADADALARGDFKSLYDRGANPYLLYFFALQSGVDRAAYYANLRGQDGSAAHPVGGGRPDTEGADRG